MLFASKDFTQLEVRVHEEIEVKSIAELPAVKTSSRAIAQNMTSILRFQVKDHANDNKEQVIIEYLKEKGWRVDRQPG